jgi:hypothetical protein
MGVCGTVCKGVCGSVRESVRVFDESLGMRGRVVCVIGVLSL